MSIIIRNHRLDAATPLAHFWSLCVGAGRANEGLRANWLSQLDRAIESCGFRYIRFHGLFHDDMFVFRRVNGHDIYNFQYVDELFDSLLARGIRPFVEFGFCPGDLATQCGTVFWWKANGSPPKNNQTWAELVSRTVRHWVGRYGIGEVRQWYFEIWNEPNLKPFFGGTRDQYFELYKASVRAIKAIDNQLRVGGPATSNFVPDARFDGQTEDFSCHTTVLNAADLDALDWRPVWIEPFMEFCRSENLPLDFISCHPYPTDWPLDSHGQSRGHARGAAATPRDLALLRAIVDKSAFPDAQIHLTEWSSSSSPRDHTHDFLQAATFVVKANLESIGLVDSLSYWTFTDVFEEGGVGDTPFHGGFGMINFQGIPKPVFHAYRFLNALGDELVSAVPGAVVTRHSDSGKLTILAYNYPPEMKLSIPASMENADTARQIMAMGSATDMDLVIPGFMAGQAFTVESMDREHGNVVTAWEQMGSPASLSLEQTQKLRRAALATDHQTILADSEGTLHLRRTVSPWSIVLVNQVV